MKKSVKIGFPIACIVIVVGTLIALVNLQNKAEELSNKKLENKVVNSVNKVTETKIKISNTNEYDYEQNKINENINKIVNNVNKNNVSKNKNSTNKVVAKEETKKVSDKDKAIAMVQAEWGSDPSVYFTSEGVSKGNYIIAVRDKSNTSVKMFYKVNLQANTVEIDW